MTDLVKNVLLIIVPSNILTAPRGLADVSLKKSGMGAPCARDE